MAQTWRVTPGKIAIARVIDAALSPLGLLGSSRTPPKKIEKILVLEPWLIGDLVIATAALRALRALFPGARITLLGKQHANDLLMHSGLVDEVVVYDLPWTARARKYDPARYDLRSLRDLVRELKARRFDVSIDARMDARSNLLTWAIAAPVRIGYDFGGGSGLLTHAVAADPDALHRVDDWLRLVEVVKRFASPEQQNIGLTREGGFVTHLAVSRAEKERAERWLCENGITRSGPLIAVHAGASDSRRRWPLANFRAVANALREKWNAEIVFFPEPGDDAELDIAHATARLSLREMMAVMSCANLVLCNDSGPMHIADALDVPVAAVFLTGNPRWHRPSREYQRCVGEGTGHDFLIAPTEAGLIGAADDLLREKGPVTLNEMETAAVE